MSKGLQGDLKDDFLSEAGVEDTFDAGRGELRNGFKQLPDDGFVAEIGRSKGLLLKETVASVNELAELTLSGLDATAEEPEADGTGESNGFNELNGFVSGTLFNGISNGLEEEAGMAPN